MSCARDLILAEVRRATAIALPNWLEPSIEERVTMYEKPELTKHEDLSQVTFSSH